MKTHLSRRIPMVVAAGLALAVLALGFLAALGVRSLVGTASADPAAPNPGHEWSQVEGHGIDGSTYWLGTTADQALELRVSGGRALRLEPSSDPVWGTSPNLVGGYSGNTAVSGVIGATIGGGGRSGWINQVAAHMATVGGGEGNTASGGIATVGGGARNTAAAVAATIGGGLENEISRDTATIGGGSNNTADGAGATIGGGGFNDASNDGATVAGGQVNTASGGSSTVGGGVSNTASGDTATVGGGNGNTASSVHATVGGGVENVASADGTTVCGGSSNRVTDEFGAVGGGYNNQAGDNGGTPSDRPSAAVGGGNSNTASGEVSFVGGGYSNTASGATASVAGGNTNTASGMNAAVAGGHGNIASGGGATVGGGGDNTASEGNATVSGGGANTASAVDATVAGGWSNTASGHAATVSGGNYNTAAGDYSLAAGRRAKANHTGSFVWADNDTDVDFASTANNEFSARATGGVRFVSAIDGSGAPTAGVVLNGGESAWSTLSSRDLKENFTTAEGREVLARLAEVPVSTWNYKAQDATIRHMGPMAQDFYAAFGLGESDTSITTVDADGVALAAIQGLYQLSQEQASRIEALETQNASLQQRLDGLEARVAALEEGTGVKAAVSQASSSGLPAAWLLLGGGLALVLGGLVLVQRRLAGGRR